MEGHFDIRSVVFLSCLEGNKDHTGLKGGGGGS